MERFRVWGLKGDTVIELEVSADTFTDLFATVFSFAKNTDRGNAYIHMYDSPPMLATVYDGRNGMGEKVYL